MQSYRREFTLLHLITSTLNANFRNETFFMTLTKAKIKRK